jgi:hypothetical protein
LIRRLVVSKKLGGGGAWERVNLMMPERRGKRILCAHHCLKAPTLQRHNTENSKQIFPEKELCGLSPHIHIHVSVSDLYVPTIGLPILPPILISLMWGSL